MERRQFDSFRRISNLGQLRTELANNETHRTERETTLLGSFHQYGEPQNRRERTKRQAEEGSLTL